MERLKGTTGLLMAAVGGAALGNILPTPADALVFHLRRKLRDKWTDGEITSKNYWGSEAAYYYLFNSSWWALVGLATFYTPGNVKDKLRTLLLLTGAGVVFSILYTNIKKDEKELLAEQNAYKTKLLSEVDPKEFENFIEELKNSK